tara:strand:+ start:2821 stop:3282 length:462 start_codon:yes stop_codon:yes gene_type:complete
MATTVTNASLTVTVSDSITLNGQSYGNTNTTTIPNIDEVYARVVEVASGSFTPIFTVGGTGQGSVDSTKVKYIRITNLDNVNYVNLKVFGTNAMVIKLEAGKSFILTGNSSGIGFDASAVDIAQSAVSLNSTFQISAEAKVASCDLELFVASI